MAKNTQEGHRIGQIKDRSQTYNPKTEMYIKRDTETGKILSCKKEKYKGVRLEK